MWEDGKMARYDLIERLTYFSGWASRDVPGVELSRTSLLIWDAIDEIERLRTILKEVDYTLTVHGHIDRETPLHDRITESLPAFPANPTEDVGETR
jgi:hypothetical protein